MIGGTVNAEREAIISLTVIGDSGYKVRLDAVVDTGYNGWLTLPSELIAELGFAWQGRCNSLLADGSETSVDYYGGAVLWDRRHRHINVDSFDSTPLIGMALLEEHELNIQARRGGSVTIRRLSKNSK
jgi:clan AA aspartic protease